MRHFKHTGFPIGHVEFEAKLDAANMVFDLPQEIAGTLNIWCIDCDIDRTGHKTPGGTAIGAALGGIVPTGSVWAGAGDNKLRVSANCRSVCDKRRCSDQRVALWSR